MIFVPLILTFSMAPRMALIPHFTPPPSKAGPAEQEQHTSHSRFPITISPLVPTSMRALTSRLIIHAAGEHARRDIAAHVAAHARHAVQDGLGMGVPTQFCGLEWGKLIGGRNVGFNADVARVQTQEEMSHGGVAGGNKAVDVLMFGCPPHAPGRPRAN